MKNKNKNSLIKVLLCLLFISGVAFYDAAKTDNRDKLRVCTIITLSIIFAIGEVEKY